jgi:hypothetical protein
MLDKLKAIAGSRRFYAALIGAALVYINSVLKVLDDTQMTQVIGVISAWIVGESVRSTNVPNA